MAQRWLDDDGETAGWGWGLIGIVIGLAILVAVAALGGFLHNIL